MTGEQPIANEDDSIHIIVNGEFYGHDAEREILRQRGHRFGTASDSEILVHYYEELGTDCMRKLRGEFAFVLWDDTNQLLFAGRDRMGMKPLFYTMHRGHLYLASEIKALLAAGVPAKWNMNAVAAYLRTGISHGSETLFAGIYSLPPGCFLLARNGAIQVHRYWDYQFAADDAYPQIQDERDWVAEFRRVFTEAIRLRLRADVPVAHYLSGGLDSCAVLGIIGELTSRPVDAFTLTFSEEDYNEGGIAERMARQVGATFHPVHVPQQALADNFQDAVWHGEGPFINGHGISKFILSQAVQKAGFKVALNGQGADEVLAGYPHFRQDLLLDRGSSFSADEIESGMASLRETNKVSRAFLLGRGDRRPEFAHVESVLGYVPTFLTSFGLIAEGLAPMLSPGFLARHCGDAPYRNFLNQIDVEGRLRGRHVVNQSLYLWNKTVLAEYILSTLSDRMEMAHSIEGRVPFLDHKVVELVATLPIRMKIRGMTEKYLLREAARPYVTEEIYARQKHPFLAPPAAVNSNGPFFSLMQDLLRGRAFAELPFFDQRSVVGTLDSLAALDAGARRDIDSSLMVAMSLHVMAERFGLAA